MPVAISLPGVMADPLLSGAWGENLSYFFLCCSGSATDKMQLSGVSWENSLNDAFRMRMKGENCIRYAALKTSDSINSVYVSPDTIQIHAD